MTDLQHGGQIAPPEAWAFVLAAIHAVVPDFKGRADDEATLELQLADPDELKKRLEAAGLTDVTVHTSVQERIEMRSGRQLWDWTMGSNAIPWMITSGLTDEQRSDVIEVLDAMIRERAGGNGDPAVLTAPLHIGVGTKPETTGTRCKEEGR
jgi:hypothetical protein